MTDIMVPWPEMPGALVVAGEANDMIPSGEVVREIEPRRSTDNL